MHLVGDVLLYVCGCCCAAGISKALETSYTRVLAKQLQDEGIMVNACCPG
jgi:hypothetical protein